jgi:hypothetical protein
MRNPIFAADTVILDQANSGKIVESDCHPGGCVLSNGERVVFLDRPLPMIRIITASGAILDMTPDTALALRRDNEGSPMRWRPLSDIRPTLKNLRSIGIDHPSYELMSHYIAGLVCGSGQHLQDPSRASFLTAPYQIAAEIEDMTLALGPVLVGKKILHEYSNRHSGIDLGDGMFYIRSRVLSHVCTDLLVPKTQELLFDLDSTEPRFAWAFLKGLISTQKTEEDGSVFIYHRYATVLEQAAHCLWWRFGVPCSLSIQVESPRVLKQLKRQPNEHHIRLSAEHLKYATSADMWPGQFDAAYTAKPISDPIVSVMPLPTAVKAMLIGGEVEFRNDRNYPLAANTLCFESLFSMPSGIAEDAPIPALDDPAKF